jgi:plasmid replication initiation protein
MGLVNLHEEKLPDFYVYRFVDFVTRVNEIFKEYISKPKRSGEARKDPGFRWFNEADFIDTDRAHLNNWLPLIQALEANETNLEA